MGSPQRSRRKCREKLSDFLCVHCVLGKGGECKWEGKESPQNPPGHHRNAIRQRNLKK